MIVRHDKGTLGTSMPLTRDRGIHLLGRSVQESDKAVAVLNARREIVWINPSFKKMLGYQSEDVIGRPLVSVLVSKATPSATRLSLERLVNAKRGGLEEINGHDKFGNEITLLIYTDHIRDIDENVTETIVTIHSNTPARMIQTLQNTVLEELVSGASLENVSEFICKKAEFITRDVISTILRVDQNGLLHPLAAPSLPQYYSDALDGIAIGPSVGSCGTAAYFGEPVLVDDIETNPLWAPYKGLALSHAGPRSLLPWACVPAGPFPSSCGMVGLPALSPSTSAKSEAPAICTRRSSRPASISAPWRSSNMRPRSTSIALPISTC